MKNKLFISALVAVSMMSCSKKNDTGSITTQETKTTNPETTTTTTVTPVDSTTAIKESTTTQTADKTTTTKTTTGEVYHYESNDGKTKFSAIFDADKGTAAVKNETTGTSYDMKSAVSADGAKYQDKDGNFFWTHKKEFDFGKGDNITISGKEVKK